ncbi:MAG: hypothetical protein Q7T05_02570 [Dehalococcoidia bacterium]|nr:hypothetical protein [Dehalococcoidia bacterium]
MKRRLVSTIVALALVFVTLGTGFMQSVALADTVVTQTYISDDSGATLAMDDSTFPIGTPPPLYNPTTWQGAKYAWGPTDGTGSFWNANLSPSGLKVQLLGSGANWIWKPEDSSPITLGDGRNVYKVTNPESISGDTVKLKRTFNIPAGATNVSATLLIAVDNAFYMYVNQGFTGTPFAEANFTPGYNHTNFRNPATGFPIEGSVEYGTGLPYPWSPIQQYDITSKLVSGDNDVEIVAINEHGVESNPGNPEANPVGVIYKLTVTYTIPSQTTPPTTLVVGGTVFPTNTFVLVAPWVVLFALLIVAGSVGYARRKMLKEGNAKSQS